jgi:predicted nucleotidyltransferase
MKEILKVLVGSQAHGLATPKSDFDYRGVFVQSTSEILKLGNVKQHTSWVEGKEDETSWEIGHFLQMAVKSNPTILEVFLAPMDDFLEEGLNLRKLFPYVWNSNDVMNAFIGYGLNQRKKFLEKKDGRPNKFAAAYLRSLVNGWELLSTGTFTVKIADLEVGGIVKRFKEGDYNVGEVIQTCYDWERKLKNAYENNPDKQTDLEAVNRFLLDVRKNNW